MHPVEVSAIQIMGAVLGLAQGRKLFPVLVQTGGSTTQVGIDCPEKVHFMVVNTHPSLPLVETPTLYLQTSAYSCLSVELAFALHESMCQKIFAQHIA